MRSVTSFFDRAVFKKTLTRFWPIWAANLVVWLLAFPLNLLVQIQNREDVTYMTEGLMWGTSGLIVAGSIILAAMTAMAVCSHLYQSRSANFFGALPVRREGIFLSVYLAGLCMMLGPNLLIFALMIPVELMGHALVMTPLLVWLAATCVMELFFFSFAVFCGMFTGHTLALPVFFGVFNALAAAAYAVGLFVMERFYYGFTAPRDNLLERIVLWLTPAYKLAQVNCHPVDGVFEVEGGGILITYTVAALAFAVAALLLYRRRQMESAGDVVAVSAMRPVFRYGVAICVGVVFGLATTAMLNVGELGMMVAMVIWAVAGCFVAQMLLDKTPKVLRKWKGSAAIALVFIAVFAVIGLDLTGYETRIPRAEQVDSVEVSGLQCQPRDSGYYWQNEIVNDPQLIETIIQLHQKAVDQRDSDDWKTAENDWRFKVTYTLRGGGKLARQYTLYDSGNGATGLVQTLLDDPQMIRASYDVDEFQEMLDKGGRLECSFYFYAPVTVTEIDEEGVEIAAPVDTEVQEQELYYTGPQAMRLWQAVLRDLGEGTIGRHDADRTYVNEPEGAVTLRFCVRIPQKSETDGAMVEERRDLDIGVPDTAGHTLETLEGLEGQD